VHLSFILPSFFFAVRVPQNDCTSASCCSGLACQWQIACPHFHRCRPGVVTRGASNGRTLVIAVVLHVGPGHSNHCTCTGTSALATLWAVVFNRVGQLAVVAHAVNMSSPPLTSSHLLSPPLPFSPFLSLSFPCLQMQAFPRTSTTRSVHKQIFASFQISGVHLPF
jgi:hypothetical protein